jgi:hypothetical protein
VIRKHRLPDARFAAQKEESAATGKPSSDRALDTFELAVAADNGGHSVTE